MTDEQIYDCPRPTTNTTKQSNVPAVEETEAKDLSPPPPSGTFGPLWLESMFSQERVRKCVEVEASKGHDDVEKFVLH